MNTPETDNERTLKLALEVFTQLANTLKQERDEAREAFVIATDQMVIAQGKVREANKERDEAREERDSLKQEFEIVTARLHGKKHSLDNGIPERNEIYILKNGNYELDA